MFAAECGLLGWVAFVAAGQTLQQLTFGHRTRKAALEALGGNPVRSDPPDAFSRTLLARLEAYAAGEPIDFQDIAVDMDDLSPFRCRVVQCCRQIAYGETLTYGQLASLAGSPGAARAVGNCMAANRTPLVVPCHRVVPADGRVGAFSASGGAATKRRLLRLEGATNGRAG